MGLKRLVLIAGMGLLIMGIGRGADPSRAGVRQTVQGRRALEDRALVGDSASVDTLRAFASRGDAEAMNLLGYMFWDGRGVLANRDTAVKYLAQAVEAGSGKGAANLGHLLLVGGDGIPADTVRGLQMLERGARLGARSAYRELSDYFDDHRGDSIHASVLKLLGDGYSHGRHLPYNYGKSIKYYYRASQLGDSSAVKIIGELVEMFPDVLKEL